MPVSPPAGFRRGGAERLAWQPFQRGGARRGVAGSLRFALHLIGTRTYHCDSESETSFENLDLDMLRAFHGPLGALDKKLLDE